MTDYFKTIRAYLRGKWGMRNTVHVLYREPRPFPQDIADVWRASDLRTEIARLKRAKKKHSHLQKQLDDLLNGGAQISDQQTETTK